MSFSIVTSEQRQVLKLEGAALIGQARDLATALGGQLEDGSPLEVDTGSLERVDTCTLQLLCSLRKTVTSLSFDRPSDAFVAAVDRCGLRRTLLAEREGA
jgi:ABC-type transporter Mla MlaB component